MCAFVRAPPNESQRTSGRCRPHPCPGPAPFEACGRPKWAKDEDVYGHYAKLGAAAVTEVRWMPHKGNRPGRVPARTTRQTGPEAKLAPATTRQEAAVQLTGVRPPLALRPAADLLFALAPLLFQTLCSPLLGSGPFFLTQKPPGRGVGMGLEPPSMGLGAKCLKIWGTSLQCPPPGEGSRASLGDPPSPGTS